MKIIKDTLQNKEEKYSRKSVTMFVSMINLVALTWCEMISNTPVLNNYFAMSINESVLWLFGSLVGGLAGVTVWDKKKHA